MNTTPTPTPTPATLTAADSHSEARDAAGEWIPSGDSTGRTSVPATTRDALAEASAAWSGYMSYWWLEEQAAAEEHGTVISGEYRIVWTDEDGDTLATLEVHAPDEGGDMWVHFEVAGRTVHHDWLSETELFEEAA